MMVEHHEARVDITLTVIFQHRDRVSVPADVARGLEDRQIDTSMQKWAVARPEMPEPMMARRGRDILVNDASGKRFGFTSQTATAQHQRPADVEDLTAEECQCRAAATSEELAEAFSGPMQTGNGKTTHRREILDRVFSRFQGLGRHEIKTGPTRG